MRSKKLEKNLTSQPHLWKFEPNCSEPELLKLAAEVADQLLPGDWLILEGELGAGKSTFARGVLTRLTGVTQGEGSPTFPIAHEYRVSRALGSKLEDSLIHIDLYRLKSEQEVDEAGVPDYFWRKSGVVMIEWLSQFPGFERSVWESVQRGHPAWRIDLTLVDDAHRQVSIRRYSNSGNVVA